MQFHLWIDCNNDAFAGANLIAELKRLLKMTRWMVGNYMSDRNSEDVKRPLNDENGNKVGQWYFQVDDTKPHVLGLIAVWRTGTPLPDGWGYATVLDKNETVRLIIHSPCEGMRAIHGMRQRQLQRAEVTSDDTPPDTPSLDTSFHDHEMNTGDDKPSISAGIEEAFDGADDIGEGDDVGFSEADEIAANMSLEGMTTHGDCIRRVLTELPHETGRVQDNVADAPYGRLVLSRSK